MSLSKHTPGPWTIVEDSPYRGPTIMAPENMTVATVDFETRDDRPLPYMANASLIAAAPEMLEALTRIVSWVDSHAMNGDFPEVRKLIHAAIAKAEGK